MERSLKARVLGQYFTPRFVADFMVSLIGKPRDARVLEPCAGMGVFLSALYDAGFRNVDAYEVDSSLPNYSPLRIVYRDFLKVKPEEKYDVVIGNPPYVRWRNIPPAWREEFRRSSYWSRVLNGLSDLTYAFIYHGVNMLREGGELVFISPVSWTGAVHGAGLRSYLASRGYLELIVFFNEMRVFAEVSTAVAIFKYVKLRAGGGGVKVVNLHAREPLTLGHLKKVRELLERLEKGEVYVREGVYEAYVSGKPRGGEPWLLPPPASPPRNPLLSPRLPPLLGFAKFSPLGSVAEIGYGMISGLDEAFQLKIGEGRLTDSERSHVIYVYRAEALGRFAPAGKPQPYIYVNDVLSEAELRDGYPNFYNQLSLYRERLARRYSYGGSIPWWHWAFPRNKHLFEKYEEKILAPGRERLGTKGYFRFTYVKGLYYAVQDVTAICPKPSFREGALYLLGVLGSKPYQEYIEHKVFRRGGVYDLAEKSLAQIPVPRVDWSDGDERKTYQKVVDAVRDIVSAGVREDLVEELDKTVEKLLAKAPLTPQP